MSLPDNPYQPCRPVTNPAYFCGRSEELSFLAERIKGRHICAISGEPLVGKTSLLYYLVHPEGARQQQELRKYLGNPGRYLFVLIEPLRASLYTASTFFRYVLDRTLEELEKVDSEIAAQVRQENIRRSDDDYEVQRLLEQLLKRQERQVVLLCDDFDSIVTSLHNDELIRVMQWLRMLNQAQDLEDKFTCVFFSLDPLERLFKIKGFTSNSPLARMKIDYRFLGMLQEKETEEYIWKPLKLSESQEVQFDIYDFKEIKQLAGRHPELIKTACYYLFQAKRHKQSGAPIEMAETLAKDPNISALMDMIWQRIVRDDTEELPLKRSFIEIASRGHVALSNWAAAEELSQRGLISINVDKSAPGAWILGSVFRTFVKQKIAEHGAQKLEETPPANNKALELHGYPLRTQLAPLEFRLFRYLVEHVERTCARIELQKAIWGDRVPNSPDALEQLIKRIREKLEPHPEYPQLLLTVRGQGYLLKHRSKE